MALFLWPNFVASEYQTYGYVEPYRQAIKTSGYANLICYSAKPVQWKLTIYQKINSLQFDNQLFIKDINEFTAGSYECHGSYSNGQPFVDKAIIFHGSKFYSF